MFWNAEQPSLRFVVVSGIRALPDHCLDPRLEMGWLDLSFNSARLANALLASAARRNGLPLHRITTTF